MPNKYLGLSGPDILKAAREDIARAGVTMSVHAEYDHLPVEMRERIRREETQKARAAVADATAAITAWAEVSGADARRTLAEQPVGTAAQEARRLANETRISRLVASSRQNGTTKGDAADLAERADKAYRAGAADEAEVLATASRELGDTRLSAEVLRLVEYDRAAADPAKAQAMKALGNIQATLGHFDRDIASAYSSTLRDNQALGQALGRPADASVTREAALASVQAKLVEASAAQAEGRPYQAPAGALTEGVTGQAGGKLPEPVA